MRYAGMLSNGGQPHPCYESDSGQKRKINNKGRTAVEEFVHDGVGPYAYPVARVRDILIVPTEHCPKVKDLHAVSGRFDVTIVMV
jgi:hypothetical protein